MVYLTLLLVVLQSLIVRPYCCRHHMLWTRAWRSKGGTNKRVSFLPCQLSWHQKIVFKLLLKVSFTVWSSWKSCELQQWQAWQRYVYGSNNGIDTMRITNNFLVGFKTWFSWGNSYLLLLICTRTHGWELTGLRSEHASLFSEMDTNIKLASKSMFLYP